MSPKKKRRRHRTPSAPSRRQVHRAGGPGRRSSDETDLLRDVRAMLREDTPWELLHFVSSIMATTDPRGADPLARARGEGEDMLGALVEAFIGVPSPETTALLTALAEMTDDEVLSRRIGRELVRRTHVLPSWLSALGPIAVPRAIEMVHVLGDGDNIALAVHDARGSELTAVVYIDHNLGTVVKDAFVIPEPLDAVAESFHEAAGADPDMRYGDIDLADARARIAEAIESASLLYPPLESDSWPACRALLEWVVRTMPDGGTGYVRQEWSGDDRAQLAERFFASPFGRGFDADDRQLLDSIMWFACDYGPGDPLRWSLVAVEILLTDWLPRKVVADAAMLGRVPQVLRSFIRFSHAERGIRPALTDETLAAVSAHELEYLRLIRSPHPQGPAALLSSLGAMLGGPEGRLLDDGPSPRSPRESLLDTLREAVGGQRALDELTDEPLPDEPLDLGAVPADIAGAVEEVAALVDACCGELLGGEARTACRRFLADVAAADPDGFRRTRRIESAAAAVVWTVAKANDLFGSYSGGLTAGQLHAWFGLTGGGSTRAATMLRALGIPARTGERELRLGTARYLVSAHRRELLQRRERFEALDL